ncbi:rho GDP-dissociation inhibitor 3 isoform X2 [Oryctolagus cuniculus]|uniref:rho GDP-dissociation inhibitor 3 isoform X2 n=1 Tax=Oryctolagus cuniculus TaxID=9986 RepID=UPI00222E7A09|nr:rho GDP-dissociation inhibitor 3 isoform X2 [Oryctolagus cuniculus]
MLGLDACELGAQLLELLRLALCARVLLADKEGGQSKPDEALEEGVLDEAVPGYQAPRRKSLLEILQLDPGDASLLTYKRVLLGPPPPVVDPSLPDVQVMRLTLLSEQAPAPVTMDLTGNLAALKDQVFVLKEGVDYRVKITFKVNREIVSGLSGQGRLHGGQLRPQGPGVRVCDGRGGGAAGPAGAGPLHGLLALHG